MKTLRTNVNIRTVGIALAVLAAAAFSPSRSEAACGNYVHILKAGDDAAPAPMPKPRCDGPNCSERPAPPITPLGAPATDYEILKPLAKFAEPVDGTDPDCIRFAIQSALELPEQIPTSIFHPPRFI